MAPHSAPPPAPEVRAPPTVGTVVNRDRVALPGHRAAAGSRVISAEPARRWWEPTSSSPRPPRSRDGGTVLWSRTAAGSGRVLCLSCCGGAPGQTSFPSSGSFKNHH